MIRVCKLLNISRHRVIQLFKDTYLAATANAQLYLPVLGKEVFGAMQLTPCMKMSVALHPPRRMGYEHSWVWHSLDVSLMKLHMTKPTQGTEPHPCLF